MVKIAVCKEGTQLSQTCSERYNFLASALHRGVSLYLESID